MASSNTFRVTPEHLSGVAREVNQLADQLRDVSSRFATGVHPDALKPDNLADELRSFLHDWRWGCEQLEGELTNLAKLLEGAAQNYTQFDEGLAAAERGTAGGPAKPTY